MPARPIDNERKSCDAVARVLEELSSAVRSNPRCPEKDGSGPPVEYVFDLAGKTYAFEHTIIEAFEDQIRTSVDFGKFAAPIEATLDHHMPSPGMYYLTFPIDPCAGLNPRDIPKTQEAVIAWTRAKAAELHAELRGGTHRLDNVCRDRCPAAIALWKHQGIRRDRHDPPCNRAGYPDRGRGRIARILPLELERGLGAQEHAEACHYEAQRRDRRRLGRPDRA